MSEEKLDFLRRWSRLKRESASVSVAQDKELSQEKEKTGKVELPPLDSLNFESDFKAFMSAKVEESVKRAALKKLFSDPRFNVMDGLDVYIDDYTKPDPLAPDIARALADACSILEPPAPAADAASSAVAANAGAPAPEQRDAAAASASPPAQIEAETPPSEAPEQAREPVSAPRAGDAPSKPR